MTLTDVQKTALNDAMEALSDGIEKLNGVAATPNADEALLIYSGTAKNVAQAAADIVEHVLTKLG